ncbi:MAG TPA: adenosylmethionine--8-amino-7-oxononanoate transaminase [Sandaracinaceae bacterium]
MRLGPDLTRADVVALERRHVWPPYTSSEWHESTDPLVVVGGEGPWIEDADGRRLLDGNASWWAVTLGHQHPRLRAALARQADALMHVAAGGITHAPVALLAKELCAVAPPGLSRVHFSDDGSTAVEVAVKIAFQYWQQNGRPSRTRFLALAGAYHGDTLGAASLAAVEEFSRIFAPLLFEVIRPPDPGEGWDPVVEHVERTLREEGDAIAGVVVEPLIQGAAGMRMHEPSVLRAIADAARAADTFLIADEVFTGYGRTGSMWACDHAGVTPDLMCVAKGFTAGVLPMAATLATERVYDGFRGGPERALMHGHTFCGNPLGAAVAREVLAIYRDEDIVGQVRAKAPLVARAFERIGSISGVRSTRARGLVGAADLGDGGYHGRLGWRVFEAALERGAFLRPLGDTVYVSPALNISEHDLGLLLDILEDSIRAVMRGL